MAKIGVIKNEEEFYNILYKKFKDYLFKLNGVKRMQRTLNIRIRSKQDIKDNIESIKIYVRGHNLFDIFMADIMVVMSRRSSKNTLMLLLVKPFRISLMQLTLSCISKIAESNFRNKCFWLTC